MMTAALTPAETLCLFVYSHLFIVATGWLEQRPQKMINCYRDSACRDTGQNYLKLQLVLQPFTP